MAERRMFSKRIIESAKFLKMPPTARLLYYDLGMRADDDGIVEAYTVINQMGATEDDLKILVAKDFVNVLNEDLVSYINDWTENNKIRSDRKIDSIYKDLLLQVLPDVNLQEKRVRADVLKKNEIKKISGQPMDNQWTSTGRPMDRIGKDRIGKDSIGKYIYSEPTSDEVVSNTKTPKKVQKHKYGEYQNVLLSDDDVAKLKDKFQNVDELIRKLDEGIELKGYKYKNHYLAILNWAKRDKEPCKASTEKSKEEKMNEDIARIMATSWNE